jgi:hypothetical protein
MPSKVKQIQFRLPWLRQQKGDRADSIAKALLEHPSIKEQLSSEICPICKKSFDECKYFQQLNDD